MDPFLGEIRIFSGNYAPQGWALCNGQLLPTQANAPLFKLLGTTFGGDGVNNFGLPDFQGRIPVGLGKGPNLSPYSVGQTGGKISHTLTTTEMASHKHAFNGDDSPADQTNPVGNLFGSGQLRTTHLYGDGTDVATFATGPYGTVVPVGGGQSHENRQPFLTLTFIIATRGIYPFAP